VSADVSRSFPDYRAIALYVDDLTNRPTSAEDLGRLERAAAAARRDFPYQRPAQHPHIAAWRRAYGRFGAKPSRYPCSSEALLARVLKGGSLPAVNAAVDAYNAVSVQTAVPIGGEDRQQLQGDCVLKPAAGHEPFVVISDGARSVTSPEPGEIVWADASGVTCRRWNWRQCQRTQLTEATTSAYFLLEALAPFGPHELRAAANQLVSELRRVSPDCVVTTDELA
jgi:DNA/RNA-binding domain of Phe-tRNA-synthetase-like protein